MDLEYDKKFAEMKQYIPFLERMIQRLEESGSGPRNPRQAQLSKIKSLRDLLMDKSKRMKLENLLKCEQVLVNLYAKVEQRDTLPGIKSASDRSPVRTQNQDLETVRQKLKSIQTKDPELSRDTLPDIEPAAPRQRDTLPDIARACQTEADCTPGSKEPALFQRRLNEASPSVQSPEIPHSSCSKRSYTRVLVSPEQESDRWTVSRKEPDDKPLFHRRDPQKLKSVIFARRSPMKSPPKLQPPPPEPKPVHKKEKKKSKSDKSKKKSKTKKLNITLKVPEESLNSLNTENIFDRIISCDDTDVDISTLRELRSQILGELKETGSNEDISDLILKSYRKNKIKGNKKTGDVEEGEISDSESEAIDNIYGSLVIVENDNKEAKEVSNKKPKASNDSDSRKIQICLVISNSEKDQSTALNESATSELTSENESKEDLLLEDQVPKPQSISQSSPKKRGLNKKLPTEDELNESLENTVLVDSDKSDTTLVLNDSNDEMKTSDDSVVAETSTNKTSTEKESSKVLEAIDSTQKTENKANFYKPINESENAVADEVVNNSVSVTKSVPETEQEKTKETEIIPKPLASPIKDKPKDTKTQSPKIPFLSEPTPKVASPKKDIVSEIDILQALKNEILSETIAIPGAEASTPALHQPKVTGKVTNAQEIVKKKISLENYKKKASKTSKPSIFINRAKNIASLEDAKKIRLTDKELERFNVPSRLSLDDYSSDEEDAPTSVADINPEDVYKDLAPRSPDCEIISDSEPEPSPVIIPGEPVKPVTTVVGKIDVDMRSFTSPVPKSSPIIESTNKPDPPRPIDPRLRKEHGNSPLLINPGGTPRPLLAMPSPFLNMTPNARSFDVTPSHNFESEASGQKHVYAPSFSSWDREDRETSQARDNRPWERGGSSMRERSTRLDSDNRSGSVIRDETPDQYSRFHSSSHDYRHSDPRDPRRRDDGYSRADGSSTPIHPFGRGDCPSTPSHPFGRADPPRTPVHPFGRSDCPTTPVHPFGRSDAPTTPIHPFGRSDGPTTPVHPFGRGDCPPTLNHPFGMNEVPRTPSHPFGRSDFQSNKPFGRSGGYSNDPRSKRDTHYDSRHDKYEGHDRSFSRDRNNPDYDRNTFENNKQRYSHGDLYERRAREHSVGRSDRDSNRNQSFERRREPSAGRFDTSYDSSYRNARSSNEVGTRRPHFERGQSVGRAPQPEPYRATSRGPSVNRFERDKPDNSVAVKPHAGHSFTIDTSVNATFQGASLSSTVSNFNDRRKRASSVGRTLTREPSVGRTIAEDFKPTYSKRFYTNKLSTPFMRARSVGREPAEVQPERSFKDMKAHFNAYKSESLAEKNKPVDSGRAKTPTRPISSRDPRSRKDVHEVKKSKESKKDSYSPGKNMRDPRVRREHDSTSSGRHSDGKHGGNKYKNDRRSDSRDKHYGIMYTNDNIAKGNVLGPGYGVKNYKIPKIKRPEPEVPPEPVKPPEPEKPLKLDKQIKTHVESLKPSKASPKPGKESPKNRVESPKSVETSKPHVQIPKTQAGPAKSQVETPKPRVETPKPHVESPKPHVGTSKPCVEPTKPHVETRKPHVETPKPYVESPKPDVETSKLCVESSKQHTETQKPGTETPNTNIKLPKTQVETPKTQVEATTPYSEPPKPQRIPRRNRSNLNKVVTTKPVEEVPQNKTLRERQSSESSDDSSPIVTRRMRRNVVRDSDDDEKKERNEKQKITKTPSPKTKKKVNKSDRGEIKSTSSAFDDTEDFSNDNDFGFDIKETDVDLFSENLASDNVIDNINDLIADLDKDIGTNKNDDDLLTQIGKENTFQSILESLTSADSSNLLEENMPMIQKPPAERLDSDPNIAENDKNKALQSATVPQVQIIKEKPNEEKIMLETDLPMVLPLHEDTQKIENKEASEAIVSTSNTEQISNQLLIEKDANLIDQNTDAGSTPDSTIDMDVPTEKEPVTQDRVPDSTNEPNTEMNPDISSTHDSNDQTKESVMETPATEKSSANPLEGFLSLLQDDSKVKELLSMLDDNEKAKQVILKLVEKKGDGNKPPDKDGREMKEPVSESKEPKTNSDTTEKLDNEDTARKENEKEEENKILPLNNDEEAEDEDLGELKEEAKNEVHEETPTTPTKQKRPTKKVGIKRKGIGGRFKKQQKQPAKTVEKPRITRANQKPKRNRELQQLQNDIRDMFISNEILNATGIRTCRIAKLVEEKSPTSSEESSPIKPKAQPKKNEESDNEEALIPPIAPKVVLEKVPVDTVKALEQPVKVRKKPGPKPKMKPLDATTDDKPVPKYKPGPKSKKKLTDEPKLDEGDPYLFDDANSDITKTSLTTPLDSSDSEDESLASSQSFGSTDLLVELKSKPKRKRKSGWSSGIIKPKKLKKKPTTTDLPAPVQKPPTPEADPIVRKLPDLECFTDKNYCFLKRVISYECRLCSFEGEGIVSHYKTQHPHYEIPLSRMNLQGAEEAIKLSLSINFQAKSKTPMYRYVCRFCYMVFEKRKNILEEFFWHVVNNHTGEFQQRCTICPDPKKCSFMLDTPPAPKNMEGLLMGYICGKCNYTQVSLENLKNHVTLRHNDEETEVYSISLGVLSLGTIKALKSNNSVDETRSLRSQRGEAKLSESKGDQPRNQEEAQKPVRSVQSKINFETDEFSDTSKTFDESSDLVVKSENEDDDHFNDSELPSSLHEPESEPAREPEPAPPRVVPEVPAIAPETDVFCQPHFKLNFTETGAKEYVCCINGTMHYKTALFISMKRHIQLKHSTDYWDGYCCVCKVIVMPQGWHKFSECLSHFLDKHVLADFPVAEKSSLEALEGPDKSAERASPKPYINVRPISELIVAPQEVEIMPKIESVISLNSEAIPNPLTEETTPTETPDEPIFEPISTKKMVEYEYEDFQFGVMSSKQRNQLDAMLTPEKLCHVFKCSGKFCSFTCDFAEDALDHITTHQRVGGAGLLQCCYCNFDASGNAIDLVTHTFNEHGSCRYCCKVCFYRAATSSLVEAHCARRHPDLVGAGPKVLLASGGPPVTQDNEGILSRNEAVDYYCCNYAMTEFATCKFKTFTSSKFVEHLAKHPGLKECICSICTSPQDTPAALVSHYATHGLMLYQCVWCKFGAETERALLDHGSVAHPTKRPQAYLRHIIETKDPASSVPKLKVLPLVHIGRKLELDTQEVPVSTNRENAKLEAERAFKLEKLIGHITHNQTQASPSPTPLPPPAEEIIDPPEPDTIIPDLREPPRETTPPRVPEVVKQEPVEAVPRKISEDVICLDSDEDEPITSANTSANTTTSDKDQVSEKLKKCPEAELYKCGRCMFIAKTAPGLKRHFNFCFRAELVDSIAISESINCAHCAYTNNDKEAVLKHYREAHGPEETLFCLVNKCNFQTPDDYRMRTHLKSHGMYKFTSKNVLRKIHGEPEESPEKRRPGKRKRSTTETRVTPTKIKRYGPDDINSLPIKQILDESVQCSLCEFSTKVRLNMTRHLQQHAQSQPVAEIAPVNPVPHLETNEMHFDRMVNLASSSSAVAKSSDKNIPVNYIHADLISRYPKYVTERKRFACGAKNCTYITIDEAMLKRHWETLHSGSYEYHCVHCPPTQQLDTSRPLTAARILAHLKMHDIKLYACSSCSYYHHQLHFIEKHLSDKHEGSGHVKVVRDAAGSTPVAPPPAAAPTMDLKPWQCGLCNFKSMLRPQVVDHCAKHHNSKFQFKCNFCPWRTSAIENVKKHHMTSHKQEAEEFYFYYREGSIPDEADGTPRWMRQRLAAGLPVETEVKKEDNPEPTPATSKPAEIPAVNLNLVKKEPEEELTLDELIEKFGAFCDPNGLKYKCPLCKSCEDDKEAMRAHLYEELKYRKWGCSFCSYKAFHKMGLKEHAFQEHHMSEDLAKELPSDINIETWVVKLLGYQEGAIINNKENLKKTLEIPTTSKTSPIMPSPQKTVQSKPVNQSDSLQSDLFTDEELETAFGPLGSPSKDCFACPKCDFKHTEEIKMREHLEVELAKVRWCCSACPAKFQHYHQAQLHCKSVHERGGAGGARAHEARRDPAARAAWLAAALRRARPTNPAPSHHTPEEENSLLMVRYEQPVPTPECRKRPNPDPDSDEDRLVIDEPKQSNQPTKKQHTTNPKKCPYCAFLGSCKYATEMHILRHYNLRPYACPYCDFTGYQQTVYKHIENFHPGLARALKKVSIPDTPPTVLDLTTTPAKVTDTQNKTLTCLICERNVPEAEAAKHSHPFMPGQFAEKNDVVYKCCVCFKLRIDLTRMREHFKTAHPKKELNYAYHRLHVDSRELIECQMANCSQKFRYLKDFKSHHMRVHGAATFNYVVNKFSNDFEFNEDEEASDDVQIIEPSQSVKRVAKKSTTKLPIVLKVARKSTTKLPFYAFDEDDDCSSSQESEIDDYSYYGTKPLPLSLYSNVTTKIPVMNSVRTVSLEKLSALVDVSPEVRVKDCKK